jgi:predicted ATPase
MLKSLEIERLRGIRQGRIDDFAPLSVLVGQNGSGKSTVLDALLIGCSANVGQAIGTAVQRRTNINFAAPWLLWRGGREKAKRPALWWTPTTASDGRQLMIELSPYDGSER